MEAEGFYLDATKTEIGFSAKKFIDSNRKILTDKDAFKFRMEFRQFVASLLNKLLQKSPVTYALCRVMECLDPELFFNKSTTRPETLFKTLVSKMHSLKRLEEAKCDTLIAQFKTARQELSGASEFNRDVDRVDCFWHSRLAGNPNFVDLWTFIKKLLLISHGQASVERGFSTNKHVMDDNMKEKTLVSQRIIHDHINKVSSTYTHLISFILFLNSNIFVFIILDVPIKHCLVFYSGWQY